MRRQDPKTIYLKDYSPPAYLVDRVDLRFEIGDTHTLVTSRMALRRRRGARAGAALELNGRHVELRSIRLDGATLPAERYRLEDELLVVTGVPARFELEIKTRIDPANNTALEGLYQSGDMLCTQCEAQGFRHITWYPDRPDVMALFSTLIIADRGRYPVLLSNGNPVGHGELPGGRHWIKWEDPFRKPSYLFALVAGDLAHIEDHYTTGSGRRVLLRLFSEPENIGQCHHGMASLKRAMAWDEQRFGLEYDLDIYMIVAVGTFNMGAMENKGLNIFNTSCVLARAETATDADFERVESVIGHEYFHNWTGNRVTCRDWFQLSLKEGLTVFRDQEFTADLHSRAVKRIDDVRALRSVQFPEDGGPMAHPIRPDSYMEISNFYTATVYEKGAEVVRMIQTLLGRDGFRRGMELYFQRHDGQAVTTEDFVAAMADANKFNLDRFRRWYGQAGTPVVKVNGRYDAKTRSYELTLSQSCAPTPGQDRKLPLHIPVAVGLLDANGNDLPLRLQGESKRHATGSRVLELKEKRQSFRFIDVPEPRCASVLRGFSAPVRLEQELSDEDLAFLLGHDSDEFNRWEAGQQLALRLILRAVKAQQQGKNFEFDPAFMAALGKTLDEPDLEPAFVADALALPSETFIAEQMEVVDVDGIHNQRLALRRAIADALRDRFLHLYQSLHRKEPYRFSAADAGRRSLKNLCLAYLVLPGDTGALEICERQFRNADNMTDEISALTTLANQDCPQREPALARFYEKWQKEPLVVNKWFSVQASSRLDDTPQRVRALADHPAFTLRNPNRVRALIGAFSAGNPRHFHNPDGSGYRLLADYVLEIDALNPQLAARLTGALSRWRRHDGTRSKQMREQLKRIGERAGLSRDVFEIVTKSLARK